MGEPTEDRWKRYNDLVGLNQALWGLRPGPGKPGHDDPRWKLLTDGFEQLVDECSRLRYWLEFVVSADDADLDQWRNGEFAASNVNGRSAMKKPRSPPHRVR